MVLTVQSVLSVERERVRVRYASCVNQINDVFMSRLIQMTQSLMLSVTGSRMAR